MSFARKAFLEIALVKIKDLGYDTGDESKNKAIVLSLKDRITTVNDLKEKASLFFENEITDYQTDAIEWIKKESSQQVFKSLKDELPKHSELNLDSFKLMMKEVQTNSGIKGQELWMPVRCAMTGMTTGPELPIVIEFFSPSCLLNLNIR